MYGLEHYLAFVILSEARNLVVRDSVGVRANTKRARQERDSSLRSE